MPQAGEALEAQPVQKLEFHLFVRQVEQLLDQQDPHHHFGRKGRAAAAFAARTRRCPINCRGQRGEVDMPLQQFERVASFDSFASRSWAANRLGFIMARSSRLALRYHAMAGQVFRGAPVSSLRVPAALSSQLDKEYLPPPMEPGPRWLQFYAA